MYEVGANLKGCFFEGALNPGILVHRLIEILGYQNEKVIRSIMDTGMVKASKKGIC